MQIKPKTHFTKMGVNFTFESREMAEGAHATHTLVVYSSLSFCQYMSMHGYSLKKNKLGGPY